MTPLLYAWAMLQGDPVEAKVEATLAKMTQEEKVDLIAGVDGFYVREVPKGGLPRLKMTDGPQGTRNDGPTTAYPAGFTLAATWDVQLARDYGTAIGRDARARGDHYWLGPGVNLARVVQNGRNFEYLGEDPYLAGRIATEEVLGAQTQGVVATVKHFAGNEHENDRNNDDSIVDERTLRELYLKPFEMVVKEGKVGAVMTSYNLLNGVHASESRPLMLDILKGEWGFDGVVMSDWGGVHSALGPYENGLDLEMPDPRYMNRANLLPPMRSGAVSRAPLDDKVRRILRVAYRMGWDARPQKDSSIPLDDPQNASKAIQVAREGTVLLKNRNSLLPLERPRQRILVVGPNAQPAVTGGGGSAYTTPFRSISVFDALRRQAPAGTTVDYSRAYALHKVDPSETDWSQPDGTPGVRVDYYAGRELAGKAILSRTDLHIDQDRNPDGVPDEDFSARWTARYTPKRSGSAEIVVHADDGIRVFVDGKKLLDEWHDQGDTEYHAALNLVAGKPVSVVVEYYQNAGDAIAKVGIREGEEETAERMLPDQDVASADAVVACVGFMPWGKNVEGEGADRPWELPAEQEAMLRRLVRLNKRVIVVLNAGAGVATKGWIDRAGALVHAGYPGGEGNLALADILYGKTSPSGKLPTSFPADLAGTYYAKAYPSVDRKMVYREGPFIGYRWFDKNGVRPLYPFGFGLSYSTFSITDPKVSGGNQTKVSVKVKNTGRRTAAEVVQLYAEPPAGPVERAPRELRAFARVELAPGRSRPVELKFDNRDLARWDVASHRWVVDPGTYRLRIGTSSRDLPLTRTIKVAGN